MDPQRWKLKTVINIDVFCVVFENVFIFSVLDFFLNHWTLRPSAFQCPILDTPLFTITMLCYFNTIEHLVNAKSVRNLNGTLSKIDGRFHSDHWKRTHCIWCRFWQAANKILKWLDFVHTYVQNQYDSSQQIQWTMNMVLLNGNSFFCMNQSHIDCDWHRLFMWYRWYRIVLNSRQFIIAVLVHLHLFQFW